MNVFITGASRGLGLEFARQYAESGARVFATCRNPASAEALRAVAARHGNLSIHALEVTDDASVTALAQSLRDQPLDVLISNAGIDGNPPGTGPLDAEPIDYEKWMQILRINTLGPFRVAMAFHEHLRRGDQPKLVTISSGVGSIAMNVGTCYAYRSSKAAVNSIMHRLAKDWATEGICVALLSPGWVQTDMGSGRAPLSPEESIRGMRQVISALTIADSGRFINYQGKEYPW